MRSISRPSRRLAATMTGALALSACGVGVTSLTSSDDVAGALQDTAATSRTVTVATQATLDASELTQLAALTDEEGPTAEDVRALQTLLDGATVRLTTADDASRGAALLWDGQVAVDVRVDAADLPAPTEGAEGDTPTPFDLAASARLDVGVLLGMVLQVQPDTSPAELLELRQRLEDGPVDAADGDPLPEQATDVITTLLAGGWVTVAGTIDPAELAGGGHDRTDEVDHGDVDMTAVEEAVTAAWTLSEPAPADEDGQTATATLDVGALVAELSALVPDGAEGVPAIDLVLTDLLRMAFNAEGQLTEARTDVLAALTQVLIAGADTLEDQEKAQRAREVASMVAGWDRTSVTTTATITDHGAVATVLDDVEPALTLTWMELRDLVARQ